MFRWIKLTSLLAFSFFALKSFSQDYNKVYKLAEETFYEEDFENALELYELLIKSSETPDVDILYKAEVCSLLSKHPNNPLDKFLGYEEVMGTTDKFYYYWKGRIMLRKHKMIEAAQAFNKFSDTGVFLSKEIRDEVNDWVIWLTDTKRFLNNPFSYEIHHLEDRINTSHAELSPVYFDEKEELLFVSNRNESNPEEYHVYHSIHRGDRTWTDPKRIEDLGIFSRNNSNIEVASEDGRLFQFRKQKKQGDLFYSNPISDTREWSSPVEFDSKITSTPISSHFFINEQEDRIIFASNVGTKRRPNLDLFESYKDVKTGKWNKPKLFAVSINSEFNEDSPYLSPGEKSLYFTSNGHGSVGGYDIYVTNFDSDTQMWSEPLNLGFPINTPDDEMHFKLNTDPTSGYFTSNRLNTNGDHDIFFFWKIHKIKIEGRITDLKTNLPLKNAQIFFKPYEHLDMYFYSEVDSKGKYSTYLDSDEIFRVEIIKNGVSIHHEDFEIHATGGEETTYLKDFGIGKKGVEVIISATTGTRVVENEEVSENIQLSRLGNKFRDTNTVVLQNIYFDFGTSQLQNESIPILTAIKNLLESTPSMQIEIGGHTDNVGGIEENKLLGLSRAEIVLKWLTKNGVRRKRMVAKSYGSDQPLASNDDEKDGRELNRRIEVVVIE